MVESRVAQGGIVALAGVVPPVRVAQAGMVGVATVTPPVRVAQGGMIALTAVTPEVRVAQSGLIMLASGLPCSTQRAQLWTIERTDGEVLRFTSLDRDFEFGGAVYRSCDSLVPSASEAVSELDAASNMDLSGAIGPDGIRADELYAGLFDGASVEAWLVPWRGRGTRQLLLRGTFGKVEQSDSGFKVELLGDGARLKQTPLVWLVQPGCRWLSATFGGFGGPFCGKDVGPLTVTGTIDAAIGQRGFSDAARAEPAGYFSRGRVTFTGGANAGVSAEIKEHRAGGIFTLWPRLAFPIAAGDSYSMIPGCTGLHEASGGTNGCAAWGQQLRFGGFRNAPGKDKRSKAADVRS